MCFLWKTAMHQQFWPPPVPRTIPTGFSKPFFLGTPWFAPGIPVCFGRFHDELDCHKSSTQFSCLWLSDLPSSFS